MPHLVDLPVDEANRELASAFLQCVAPEFSGQRETNRRWLHIATMRFDFVWYYQVYGRMKGCPKGGPRALAVIDDLFRFGFDFVQEQMARQYDGTTKRDRDEIRDPENDEPR
jgi:hypothetical protein